MSDCFAPGSSETRQLLYSEDNIVLLSTIVQSLDKKMSFFLPKNPGNNVFNRIRGFLIFRMIVNYKYHPPGQKNFVPI
jgi:hypothetical protein